MAIRSTRDGYESSQPQDWEQALRDAIDDSLLEVRYRPEPDGIEFLVVHQAGAKDPALDRFLSALRSVGRPVPFDVRLAESGTENQERYADYVRVGS